MPSPTRLEETVFPTGLVLFGPLPGDPTPTPLYLMWSGPSASLRLTWRPLSPDGGSVSIDHPTANGQYETRAEARAAANRFAQEVD